MKINPDAPAQFGLTVRAAIAKDLMAAILVNASDAYQRERAAALAVEYADSLIAELNNDVAKG